MRALIWRLGRWIQDLAGRGLRHTDPPCEACRMLGLGSGGPIEVRQ